MTSKNDITGDAIKSKVGNPDAYSEGWDTIFNKRKTESIALIDADILIYRCGFASQTEPYEIAEARLNELVEKILADTGATSYKLFLTASADDTAFRSRVYLEYKQNRKAPKPIHYQALREFLCQCWGAEIVSCIEADDALGIEQMKNTYGINAKSIVVTIDKDLDMIPGWHYNFVKGDLYFITNEQAIYNFYKQLLMGDTADNVKGIEGIGPKKADKILAGAKDETELFERAREAYGNDEEMAITGEVLWILREPYPQGRWSSTEFGSKLKQDVSSMPSLDLKQNQLGLEFTMEETLTDGFLQNGAGLQEVIASTENKQLLI